ncbi:hypothetical protein, partial [Chryseobacterium sp.]|uniref:hypothetical protein n=1 Tax=Chryseobacterium sp. TaxID=1871047 RepID=UPI002FC64D88
MIKFYAVFILLISTFSFAQNLTTQETINYINNLITPKVLSVDNLGYITISNQCRFHYKEIKLIPIPWQPYRIDFSCKEKDFGRDDCVQMLNGAKFNGSAFFNSTSLKFEVKENFQKTYKKSSKYLLLM